MHIWLTALAALAMQSATTWAEDPDPKDIQFFEKRIRPVLDSKCYRCHSTKSEDLKGNLILDSREGILKGGDNGPAVTPGDDDSFLLRAIRYEEDDYQMPPEGALPDEVIADFEKMGRNRRALSAEESPENTARFHAARHHATFAGKEVRRVDSHLHWGVSVP